MLRLKVYQSQDELFTLELVSGQEYKIGRGTHCDIKLEDKTISREHLHVLQVEGQWVVKCLNKYGELYQNDQKIAEISLAPGVQFEVPPFIFVLDEGFVRSEVGYSVDTEHTFVGQAKLIPHLKVQNTLFRLEGFAWTAGRDPSCAIFIDDSRMSRKHFEIEESEGQYFLKDLGSSNGTSVNGTPVTPKQRMSLASGDVIQVVDLEFHFELRDESFREKVEALNFSQFEEKRPAPIQQFENYDAGYAPPAYGSDPAYPNSEFSQEMVPLAPPAKKKNYVRLALMGLIPLALIFFLMDDEKPSDVKVEASKPQSPFDRLSPEKQQYVKESYKNADRFFKEQKFELARQEVERIHTVIESYENSVEILKLAEEAILTQQQQAALEAKEKEMQEIEENIKRQVVKCKALLGPNVVMPSIEECLAPILQFNPDHPEITDLRMRAEQIIAEREQKAVADAAYQAKVRARRAIYEKAEKIYKDGKLLVAIPAYEDVVKSSLPDPEGLKGASQRKIAAIQQELSDKQANYELQADNAYKNKNWRDAVTNMKLAVEINPDNEVMKGKYSQYMVELRKEMMELYQVGILEESVGNVEKAKEMWKQIINKSVPEEDYFKKASIKLKKYGAI